MEALRPLAPVIPLVWTTPAPPSVGVVFPGDPSAPGTWSGTPSGLISGLTAVGARPRALTATPSRRRHALLRNAVALAELPRTPSGGPTDRLRLGRAIARNTPSLSRSYTRAAHRAVRTGGEVDGLVQIGTGYGLPDTRPVATYEDMTIHQALALGYPDWQALTRGQRANRLRSQMRAYDLAAVCCFTSWWAARSAIDDYGVPESKVRVIGVGANHIIDPPPERDWTVPRFLFIGWDWERKNGAAVLRAFARLRADIPEATLHLVGRHAEVRAAGVTDHGILRLSRPGERARLEPLLRGATCFVMPSRAEPSAIAYVEAMHAGLPAIGTTVGGAGNLIGQGGCVVDPGCDDALLAAMRAFSDPARASATGAAAHERAGAFTWPAVGARVLRALDLHAPRLEGVEAFIDRCSSPEITA